MIRFLICNVFISGIIGILLIAKRIFKNNLSSRMQYNLWFLLLGLLAVPFIPALGKNSGKANIRKNLEALGIDMDEGSMRKVTERIIELGDKKEMVTPEDLPYIISDVLHHDNALEDQKIRILNYSLSLAQGLKPVATLKIEINGEAYEESASGDGQYDAFVRALRRIYSRLNRPFPMLTNYSVSIPPGGRTDAFVQTVISWNYAGVDFKTRGLDADQTEAAIKATLKMLNKIED